MVALHQTSARHLSERTRVRLAPRRVAVVLNPNARKVDAETLSWIRAVVPREDLFISRALDELPALAERLVRDAYDAVLWGGGDGTFTAGVAAVAEAAQRRGRPLPDMGVLQLGTGNALACAIGAGPATPDGVALELSRARAHARRQRLAMLEVEGRPSMFCGFGLDAQILDDFGRTVGWLRWLGVARHLQSANARYFLAVTTRSIPRFVLSQRAEVVAINRGAPAIRVNVDGEPVGDPVPAGRVLWRGQATLAAAATIPYYGLGLKMFPHAQRRPGRFQLRLSDASTFETLSRLPQVWKGRYQGDHIFDFLVDRVELVVSRPAPFQSGGDLVGERSSVTVGLWDRAISVI